MAWARFDERAGGGATFLEDGARDVESWAVAAWAVETRATEARAAAVWTVEARPVAKAVQPKKSPATFQLAGSGDGCGGWSLPRFGPWTS